MGGGRDVRTGSHGVGTSDREVRGGYGRGMQRTNGCLPGPEPGPVPGSPWARALDNVVHVSWTM